MAASTIPDSAKVTTLASLSNSTFDYIVIGGGTSGCLLASRLTSCPSTRYSVLLVEAGGEATEDPENLIPGLVVPKFGKAEGNWLYATAPQRALRDRTIVYPRGRGLGGSSANNFSSWVRGPACDWDAWAAEVGDEWWEWVNVVEYMKKLEDFRAEVPEGMERFVRPTEGMHHVGGPIGVGTGSEWQGLVKLCLEAAMQIGLPLNTDHNDGEATGVSVAQMNVDRGVRRSSAAAFLGSEARSKLDNLVVVTKTICKRILFRDKTAVGVELLPAVAKPGDFEAQVTIHCKKEIVLSAGTFETPHVLLLSGVGPAADLAKHNIPLVHDSPYVGRNIRDHSAFSIEAVIDPSIAGHNQLLKDPVALAEARRQYDESQTGPLSVFGASAVMVFARLPDLYTSPAFHTLPTATREFLAHPHRPSTELWLHGGPLFYTGQDVRPEDSVIAIEGLCQNLLSAGSLTLRSADPRELPSIDPAYCSEPYDWRIAIETVKLQLRVAKSQTMQGIIRRPLYGPGQRDADGTLTWCSEDDEDAIRAFLEEELTQGFHSMGSCVMGHNGKSRRVVDAQFRVLDLQNLRIADMSVCPLLTNNHTQINAYLIAERCAQVMLGDGGEAGFGNL